MPKGEGPFVKIQLPIGISHDPAPSGFSWLHSTPTDNWYLINVQEPGLLDPNLIARQVHRVGEYLQDLGDILPTFP